MLARVCLRPFGTSGAPLPPTAAGQKVGPVILGRGGALLREPNVLEERLSPYETSPCLFRSVGRTSVGRMFRLPPEQRHRKLPEYQSLRVVAGIGIRRAKDTGRCR